MRLHTLMSNELSYNLETSIAFYVQLLLIKISKNTKLQGDFPLLVLKNIVNCDKTVRKYIIKYIHLLVIFITHCLFIFRIPFQNLVVYHIKYKILLHLICVFL